MLNVFVLLRKVVRAPPHHPSLSVWQQAVATEEVESESREMRAKSAGQAALVAILFIGEHKQQYFLMYVTGLSEKTTRWMSIRLM